MVTVKKNRWLLTDLVLKAGEKLPFAEKRREREVKNICGTVKKESYLDIPTFIRQGRVISQL